MPLFTIHLDLPEGGHSVEYESIAACLHDPGLRTLLEAGDATAAIRVGRLTVTAKPITTWEELTSQVAKNASTILSRYR